MEGSDLTDVAFSLFERAVADLRFAVLATNKLDDLQASSVRTQSAFRLSSPLDVFLSKHGLLWRKELGADAFLSLKRYLQVERGIDLDAATARKHAALRGCLEGSLPGWSFWILDDSVRTAHLVALDPARYDPVELRDFYGRELAGSEDVVLPTFGEQMVDALSGLHANLERVTPTTVLIVATKEPGAANAAEDDPAAVEASSRASTAPGLCGLACLVLTFIAISLDPWAWIRALVGSAAAVIALAGLYLGARRVRRVHHPGEVILTMVMNSCGSFIGVSVAVGWNIS